MFFKIKDFICRILYVLIFGYLLIFVPILWGQKPLVVVSGSMEPTLKTGGILYYHDANYENLKSDDILVYETQNYIVSHRIVEIVEEGIVTKGDANDGNDALVDENQILGIGTNWSIPYIGYYADFIYTHKYLLFVSVGILIIDLCNDFYNDKKRIEEKNNEKNN